MLYFLDLPVEMKAAEMRIVVENIWILLPVLPIVRTPPCTHDPQLSQSSLVS